VVQELLLVPPVVVVVVVVVSVVVVVLSFLQELASGAIAAKPNAASPLVKKVFLSMVLIDSLSVIIS
jgi:hypothetical protein